MASNPCPEEVELCGVALNVGDESVNAVLAVSILVRMVVVSKNNTARIKKRLCRLDLLNRFSMLITKECISTHPGNIDALNAKGIYVLDILSNRAGRHMCRNALKAVLFKHPLHLGGSKAVEACKLNAVVACRLDLGKHGIKTVFLYFILYGIKLYSKSTHYAHHISAGPPLITMPLTNSTAFSRPSLGLIRLSSCSIETVPS